MHIVLGLLTAIVTILVLLNRLAEAGISLGGLNPFLRQRRRKWRQGIEGNPIYRVDDPMEATALLMTAMAKVDGDISAEEKRTILAAFTDRFGLSRREAAALMVSSVYLYGDGEAFRKDPRKVLKPSRERFSEAQARSAVAMLEGMCAPGCSSPELKRELLDKVREPLLAPFAPKGTWE